MSKENKEEEEEYRVKVLEVESGVDEEGTLIIQKAEKRKKNEEGKEKH